MTSAQVFDTAPASENNNGRAVTNKNQDADRLIDELLEGKIPEDFNALFKGLKKAIFERALGAELTHHLNYARAKISR